MNRIVECVPNFSDGRDTTKVDAIIAEIRGVAGVVVLAHESDADHNRSVVTLVGEPEAVAEAAVRGVGKAAELIDLTQQIGVHPRIGAADVVPFIPIKGVTLDECVALAKHAGREIWTRYRVPVYLYEAAAQRPERTNLENIRRGQFEGLREEVLRNPDRAPDIGEARLHPTAGATVVGARKLLVAYNILLSTADVHIAKRIAKAVRFSSGGLRYVKAMGVFLKARNLAQVSMNLTDFERTPVHVVFEMVKREAERYGVAIAGSELIGLIPRRALEMSASYYLQIENFSPDRVLEDRIDQALGAVIRPPVQTFGALVEPFLAAVAQPTIMPGGGSVAALAGALAASIGQMVTGLSCKQKEPTASAETVHRIARECQAASRALSAAIDRDPESFRRFLDARKLPHETAEERKLRDSAIQQALQAAVEAPLDIARNAVEIFEKLRQLERLTSPSMFSDIYVGRLMAAAAVRGTLQIVTVNLEDVSDGAFAARTRAEADAITSRIAQAQASASR